MICHNTTMPQASTGLRAAAGLSSNENMQQCNRGCLPIDLSSHSLVIWGEKKTRVHVSGLTLGVSDHLNRGEKKRDQMW